MTWTNNNDENDSDSDAYEPEYEAESISIASKRNDKISRYTFEVMTVVPPPLEYMSTLHTQEQEISGRQVWCGSGLLAHFLLHSERSSLISGQRILELGSGTGVVGMLASKLGARCVALTDGDSVAVDLLQQNLSNEANAVDDEITGARHLLWGTGTEEHEGNSTFDRWCREKWPGIWDNPENEPEDNVTFDVILAGDVLYKSGLPELFFASIDRYLTKDSNCSGELYLCHVPRSVVNHEVVIQAAKVAGFQIDKLDITSLLEEDLSTDDDGCCPVYDAERAAIYRVTRLP